MQKSNIGVLENIRPSSERYGLKYEVIISISSNNVEFFGTSFEIDSWGKIALPISKVLKKKIQFNLRFETHREFIKIKKNKKSINSIKDGYHIQGEITDIDEAGEFHIIDCGVKVEFLPSFTLIKNHYYESFEGELYIEDLIFLEEDHNIIQK